MIRKAIAATLTCAAAGMILAGCDKKTDDSKASYTAAINAFYAAEPACLWDTNLKLPVQADTSNTAKTTGYDALVDQGLLARTTAEKKVLIVASKQVTNYDLSDKGRQAWTPDTRNPGFGNFCYGTPHVISIDSSAPANDPTLGPVVAVQYHAGITGAPAWASAPETQNAFPRLQRDLSTQTSQSAMLKLTPNGYIVAGGVARRTPTLPSTANPDGSIVQ